MRYSQLSSDHPRSLNVYENQSIQSFFESHQILQNMPPCIVVAGTNGKGSVCRILQQIYSSQGYRVGSFVTPHLLDFKERIQINGKFLSSTSFSLIYENLSSLFKSFSSIYGRSMTFFEMALSVAVKAFESCDLAIIEVGLGGARDATRVFEPDMNLFTSISLDHCHILGDSLAAIQKEKLGILKPGARILTIPQQQNSLKANCIHSVSCSDPQFEKYLQSFYLECSLGSGRIKTPLLGDYQLENIQLAIQAVLEWQPKFQVHWINLVNALNVVRNPCRLEWIHPRILIDGSHNQLGCQRLVDYLSKVHNSDQIQWAVSLKETKHMDTLKDYVGLNPLCFNPKKLGFHSQASLARELNGQACKGLQDVFDQWILSGKQILLVTGSLIGAARFKRRCLKILDSIEKKTCHKYSALTF